MLIFQPPVNFCSNKNIQTIFGTKLEDFWNYRIDYNLISQVVQKVVQNSYLFNEFLCNLGFFWHEWASLKLEWNESFKGPLVPKKAQLHKNELNTTFFCSTSPPPKGSQWPKIFKISLTFRFDKLSNLSNSVHTGENSQILTVSNKIAIYVIST
jgi:hypothetical protein